METVLLWDCIGTLVLFLWAKRSMNIEFIPQNSPILRFNSRPGFCLGYLRGSSFPRKTPSFPPKMLWSLQYISNYIGKIIQTRWGQCTHSNISHNCVSKCTRLHLSVYSFQKNFRGGGGGMPRDPHRKLVTFSHLQLLPQTINSR